MPVSTLSQAADLLRAAPGLEQPDLERLVHERLERMARRDLEPGGVAEALEQHDARPAARLAQRHRLLEPRDRERVGAVERLARRSRGRGRRHSP